MQRSVRDEEPDEMRRIFPQELFSTGWQAGLGAAGESAALAVAARNNMITSAQRMTAFY